MSQRMNKTKRIPRIGMAFSLEDLTSEIERKKGENDDDEHRNDCVCIDNDCLCEGKNHDALLIWEEATPFEVAHYLLRLT
jgi:hypothetical protein